VGSIDIMEVKTLDQRCGVREKRIGIKGSVVAGLVASSALCLVCIAKSESVTLRLGAVVEYSGL
jgi:hypothetical protein